jgi:hypothetical protein
MNNGIEKNINATQSVNMRTAPKMEWLRVTPQMADEWLKLNTENRPIKPSHVKFLQTEIMAGRFLATGQPIVFVGKKLVDGQHRLLAIVRADKAVDMMVVHHPVNEQTKQIFHVIDTGVNRSFADLLSLKGETNATTLAAVLRTLERYYAAKDLIGPDDEAIPYSYLSKQVTISRLSRENVQSTGLTCTYDNPQKLTRKQELTWLEKYPESRTSTTFAGRYTKTQILTNSTLGALHYILTEVDPLRTEDFLIALVEGGSPRDSALHLIRETLIRMRSDSTATSRSLAFSYVALLVFSAWNATKTGKTLKKRELEAGRPIPLPM